MDIQRAEQKVRIARSRSSRVRGALAALYLRRSHSGEKALSNDVAIALRGLAAICDMVFFSTESPLHWASFDPDEKLLWRIAYGLHRQCIQTEHRHLIERVRRHVRVLARCATIHT